MNKKGFTLIELLAVIVILGIISTIVVPNIMGVFSEKKQILYDTTIDELERLSRMYLTDNPDLYKNIDINGYVDITTDVLCTNEYIECPITDPRDNSELNGYVRVTAENDNFIYEFVRVE